MAPIRNFKGQILFKINLKIILELYGTLMAAITLVPLNVIYCHTTATITTTTNNNDNYNEKMRKRRYYKVLICTKKIMSLNYETYMS